MDISCFVDNCSNPVASACDCNESLTYFCFTHSGDHLQQNRKLNHHTISLEKTLKNDEKSSFISMLEKALETENSLKNQIKKLVFEVNKEAEEILKKSNQTCKKIKDLLKDAQIKDSITVSIIHESMKNRSFLNINDISLVQEMLTEYKKKDFKFFSIKNDLVSFNINYSKPKNDKKIKKNKKSIDSQEFLYFFKDKTDTLVCFNLENLNVSMKNVQFIPHGIISPCLLQIDSDTLFVHGGRDSETNMYYSKTVLLDIKTLNYEQFCDGIPISNSKPIILNGEIFIFGGFYNKKSMNTSQKFNLERKSWKMLTNLPEAFTDSSSIDVKDFILITGLINNSLFKYIPDEDCFEIIVTFFSVSFSNIFIKFNGNLYIVTDKIFETSEENLTSWEILGTNHIKGNNINTNGIYHNNNFYFADYKGQVFRFDCILKTLMKVKDISESRNTIKRK